MSEKIILSETGFSTEMTSADVIRQVVSLANAMLAPDRRRQKLATEKWRLLRAMSPADRQRAYEIHADFITRQRP